MVQLPRLSKPVASSDILKSKTLGQWRQSCSYSKAHSAKNRVCTVNSQQRKAVALKHQAFLQANLPFVLSFQKVK
jgi:hypothetical protein